MKLKLFSIVILVLLSSYLTREFFPRRIDHKSPFSVNPIPREGPPPGIEHSFKYTEIYDFLEERDGLIG
jgi:hypothetical protein